MRPPRSSFHSLRRTFTFAAFLAGGAATCGRAQDGYIFTTLVGKADFAGSSDGVADAARFRFPSALAISGTGDLYVADTGNATIRKIVPNIRWVSTVAGAAGVFGSADGGASAARFGFREPGGPAGIAVDANGTIYVSDVGNTSVRMITGGVVTTVAGHTQLTPFIDPSLPYLPTRLTSIDGTGASATFASPSGLALDRQGNLYVADTNVNKIRKISPARVVTTHLGPWLATLTVGFDRPMGIAVDAGGSFYIVDSNHLTIRKVSSDGVVTTLAGSERVAGSADGSGAEARFGELVFPGLEDFDPPSIGWPSPFARGPTGIAIDARGNVLVADTANNTIRKITPAGVVTTVGGRAGAFGAKDGIGGEARFLSPQGLAVDGAGNLYVADCGNHTIRKGAPVYRPSIQANPQGETVSFLGTSLSLSVEATSILPMGYVWAKNGISISGATNASLALPNLQASDAGSYTVVVSNEVGSVISAAARVMVGGVPDITTQPTRRSVLGGQGVSLSVSAGGTPTPTFQWRKDGEPILGATTSTFTIPSAQGADAGNYTVVVTNALGSVVSAAAAVTVNTSRIINLSIRSGLSPDSPLLTVGFVVSGSGKNILTRAVGPALAQFGLTNALADPRIALLAGSTPFASNDNWGTATNVSQVSATAAQSGAFPLGAGSNDAAMLGTFDGGTYSAQVSGTANAGGIVLVELYDANATHASRLVNVSTRAHVGTGDNILVAGFVVSGNAQKTLLIRAVGPTLAAFGVTGFLADPRLEIVASGANRAIAANDNWGGTAALTATFAAQGAFPFVANDSNDAALVVTLDPGSYSAQVSGAAGSTGEALIELYELP